MPAKLFAPEAWQRIKDTFDRAAPLAGEARAALLADISDSQIRDEAQALLTAHDEAGDFLEPARREAPSVGQRLGPYELEAHLGGGGMGDVYRARDPRLARNVAIKVLRPRPGDAEAPARMLREARAIAALSHPNVLAIYDVGDDRGVPYLVTELLDGETLRERLRRDVARPSLTEVATWGAAIARGLAAAHAAGIVHRDLKPENVFLLRTGEIKVLDFGLARFEAGAAGAESSAEDSASALPIDLSRPGRVIGTAGYLSPEQARGEVTTAATDLFALGAILFELVTGERAFPGETARERMRAAQEREPPPVSSLRAEMPRWLERIIARCLAKDVQERFESARDLAFALEAGLLEPAAPPGPQPPRLRRGPWLAAAGGAVVLAALLAWSLRPRPTAPRPLTVGAHQHALTYGGYDREPAVSPDGRFLAFTSERDGTSRIWLKQLDTGSETALTDGEDRGPRFSPDGNQVMFTRLERGKASLYRVDLLGSEAHKVVDDASDGDWAPDGERVAFLRPVRPSSGGELAVMATERGGGERELHRLNARPQRGRNITQYLRWSPDGAWIAVTGLVNQPGAAQTVQLVPAAGGPPRLLQPLASTGLISAVAWDGPDAIVYSQASSVSGNLAAGSSGRLVRQTLRDGVATLVMWTTGSSVVVDRWPGRGMVFDLRAQRQNLREFSLDGAPPKVRSHGTSTDRQPSIAPDGSWVVFSSNRDGTDLDLWRYDRGGGVSRRLTDHPRDDWDPAISPDGRWLLWSSNRSGTFEVWMANADGTNPRQVTNDGDAENPSIGRDGAWIVYASGVPARAGVWRVRPDGTDPTLLVPKAVLPEISPDGAYALFLQNREPMVATVGVVRVADGEVLPFEISVKVHRVSTVLLGRARWTPKGDAIAFIGQDEAGAPGIFVQPFDPQRDTASQRKPLVGFHPERLLESFDLDDLGVVVAEPDSSSDVMVAEGVQP
ncbi:MAG: protein kinase [Kofleriaceae bacterium]